MESLVGTRGRTRLSADVRAVQIWTVGLSLHAVTYIRADDHDKLYGIKLGS